MNKYFLLCGLTVYALSLSGCSSVSSTLGLDKEAPDEFAVLTRAPLEMPSKFSLPPPTPGIMRPQEKAADLQAREVLLGEVKVDINSISSGEEMLLQRAQASEAAPHIRAIVNKETLALQDRNKPVAKKLLNIGGDSKTPSATVVDAKKELERIHNNKKEGKGITEGETPVIEE